MKLLTPPELADLLGIPEATLAQWRYRHVGPPYVKVGRHIRYRVEDIEAWVEAQTVTPEDAPE